MGRARIFNDSDIAVVINIAKIDGPNQEFHQFIDSGEKSNITDLDNGDRVFIAWDAITKKLAAPARLETVTDLGARFRFIGTGGAYDWSVNAVPTGQDP